MLALFIAAALAYGAASFAFGAQGERSTQTRAPRLILLVAALLHVSTIGAQCVDGNHPFRSVYLASSLGVLLTVLGFLALSARRRPMRSLGAVLAPVGLVGLTIGVVMGPGGASAGETSPALLNLHIGSAVLGVSGFALAAGIAGMYLAMERRLRSKQFRPGNKAGISLTGLDKLHAWIVLLATPVFTVAIVTGAVVMIRSGDLPWSERTIELVAAAVAWVASVVGLSTRAIWGVRGRRAAMLTMISFLMMLMILVSYGIRT